jgi:hypothetical protein
MKKTAKFPSLLNIDPPVSCVKQNKVLFYVIDQYRARQILIYQWTSKGQLYPIIILPTLQS